MAVDVYISVYIFARHKCTLSQEREYFVFYTYILVGVGVSQNFYP